MFLLSSALIIGIHIALESSVNRTVKSEYSMLIILVGGRGIELQKSYSLFLFSRFNHIF